MPSHNMKLRKTKVDPASLPAQQLVFAQHYMADPELNGTRAAREAGYKHPAVAAAKMLKDGHRVKKYIAKMMGDRLRECDLSSERILRKLETVLFFDPIHVFESVGDGVFRVKSLQEIPEEIRCCITKAKAKTRTIRNQDGEPVGEDCYVEIEFMSKDAALQLAMKYRNLVKGDQQTTNINVHNETTLIANLLEKAETDRRGNVVDGTVIERKVIE